MYMNYLLSENDVLFSRFLIFFLSCTNLKKFYERKDKDYIKYKSGDNWLNVVAKKFNSKEPSKPPTVLKELVVNPPLDLKTNPEGLVQTYIEDVKALFPTNQRQYKR